MASKNLAGKTIIETGTHAVSRAKRSRMRGREKENRNN